MIIIERVIFFKQAPKDTCYIYFGRRFGIFTVFKAKMSVETSKYENFERLSQTAYQFTKRWNFKKKQTAIFYKISQTLRQYHFPLPNLIWISNPLSADRYIQTSFTAEINLSTVFVSCHMPTTEQDYDRPLESFRLYKLKLDNFLCSERLFQCQWPKLVLSTAIVAKRRSNITDNSANELWGAYGLQARIMWMIKATLIELLQDKAMSINQDVSKIILRSDDW